MAVTQGQSERHTTPRAHHSPRPDLMGELSGVGNTARLDRGCFSSRFVNGSAWQDTGTENHKDPEDEMCWQRGATGERGGELQDR